MDKSIQITSVDVTLHKYNHFDNRLWVEIKNNLDYMEINEDSVIVSAPQVKSLLENLYMSMINKVKSVGSDFLHKNVHSPYFIYMMCKDLTDLKFIRFNKSYDKSFSRLLEIEGDKLLKFDFKVLSMTFKLYELYDNAELLEVNNIFEKLHILEEDVPYSRIHLIQLLDTLDLWITSEIDKDISDLKGADPIPLITTIMDMIDPKTEKDDPLVSIVTDY